MNAAENLQAIRMEIADAAHSAGRKADDITLVAVSKTKPRESVEEFLECGQTLFGENRIAEAREKFSGLTDRCEVHLIGPVQSNKASQTIGFFNLIHSVDRPKIALKLNQLNAEAGLVQDILIQVNTSGEDTKSGFRSLEELSAFMDIAVSLDHLRICGFMTMAPFTDNEKIVRETFSSCREWRDVISQRYRDLNLDALSMGMTGDFKWAILEGATHLRIGSALFGNRG